MDKPERQWTISKWPDGTGFVVAGPDTAPDKALGLAGLDWVNASKIDVVPKEDPDAALRRLSAVPAPEPTNRSITLRIVFTDRIADPDHAAHAFAQQLTQLLKREDWGWLTARVEAVEPVHVPAPGVPRASTPPDEEEPVRLCQMCSCTLDDSEGDLCVVCAQEQQDAEEASTQTDTNEEEPR